MSSLRSQTRPAPFVRLIVGLAALCLGMGTEVRLAQANAAARSFFDPTRGQGALTIADTRQVRAERVSVSLDFRLNGRGTSRAEYLLANLDGEREWEDEIIFVSSAESVTVTVDGIAVPTERRGQAFSSRPELVQALGPLVEGHGFRVRLAPRQQRLIAVDFDCKPALLRTYGHAGADGLTRELRRDKHRPPDLVESTFSYPLWPAYGFGGGVGPMTVSVLTDQGALPPPGPGNVPWTVEERPQHEKRWRIVLPAADSIAKAPLRDVIVRYPARRPVTWSMGATGFAGVRFATRNEGLARFHLAASADLIVHNLGAFSLGGETAFSHSASISLGFQRGEAGEMAAYYLGGSGLLTFGPT
ncbi:MAG TPA: hypothetical protein VF518_15230, partial [Polyangia bacterium]